MISLELLVEEESADMALKPLVGKILEGDAVRVRVRRFQGKPDLLKKLPDRLEGYAAARRRGEDVRVVVLVDQDNDDCAVLKGKLDSIAEQAGLTTRAKRAGAGPFQVLNRIAIRELESWYFGDWAAVRAAFPKVTQDVPRNYRNNPDSASGKCSDAFEKVLRANGVRIASKPEWGRRIGPKLSPTDNRSPSFNAFVAGLYEISSPDPASKKKG
ncbi:DUF4276 family protein [Streptomyces sp. NPDC050428]|uniref:DUF4276 family protein n=1 Tax=Streptomyces sp. NPDC050428 TaxID=3155757 RepID=UPI0034229359